MKVTIARKMSISDFVGLAKWLIDNYDFSEVVEVLWLSHHRRRTKIDILTKDILTTITSDYQTMEEDYKNTEKILEQNHIYSFKDHNVGMVFALKFDGAIS